MARYSPYTHVSSVKARSRRVMKHAIVFGIGVATGVVLVGKSSRVSKRVSRYIGSKIARKLLDALYETDERDQVYDQYRDDFRNRRTVVN
jgi:hypothetical protein